MVVAPTLQVKKLHPDAVIPKMATPGSAGMDLTAISVEKTDLLSEPDLRQLSYKIGEKLTFGTGLAFAIPSGYVGLIFPRSSIHKFDMTLTNCVGVIDSDYRGEVKFVFKRSSHGEAYKVGDRVGQLVLMRLPDVTVVETEELSTTERGEGGFGSTGR